MEYVLNHIPEILSAVVTISALIAALTPTPKDDGIVKKVRKAVDFLAMNWGNAKNEDKRNR